MSHVYDACPCCGSHDTESDGMEFYNGALYVNAWCNTCGAVFDEVFQFSHSVVIDRPAPETVKAAQYLLTL